MYKIERMDYGFKLTFADFITVEEMENWVEESKRALIFARKDFGVLIDMRRLKPLPKESRAIMEAGQKSYREKGMARSVVIVESVILKMQFKKIAQDSGIYAYERYIDSSSDKEWENSGLDWIVKGIDPDKS